MKIKVLPLMGWALCLWFSCRPQPQANAPRPAPVTAVTVGRQEIATVIDVAGRIVPQGLVAVYSQVSGKVVRVRAEVGDRVRANSVLAEVVQESPGSQYLPHPVRSPRAGMVMRSMAAEGMSVTPQTPLFEIGDVRCLLFTGQVFGGEQSRVEVGQRMALVDASGDTIMGLRLSRIAPQLDPVTGGLDIEASICMSRSKLIPGQSVDGFVIVGKVSGLALPRAAVIRGQDGGWGVFEIVKGRAQYRPVAVKYRGQEFFLIEGLEEGSLVAVDGSQSLSPGQPVAVQPDTFSR